MSGARQQMPGMERFVPERYIGEMVRITLRTTKKTGELTDVKYDHNGTPIVLTLEGRTHIPWTAVETIEHVDPGRT